jgi:hypothetical protein
MPLKIMVSFRASDEPQTASGRQVPQANRGGFDESFDMRGVDPASNTGRRLEKGVHAAGEPGGESCRILVVFGCRSVPT